MVRSVSQSRKLACESQVDKGRPYLRLDDCCRRGKQEALVGKGAQGLAKQVTVGGEIPPGSPRIWVEILEEVARREGWEG